MIFLSSQPITLWERRLNQISNAMATPKKATSSQPTMRARLKSAAVPGAALNHSKLTAKNKTTAIMSYKRSTMMVTKDAAGRTRLSRIGSTAGRTTSAMPAQPASTAPNPTVVAIHTSRRLAFVSGARNACQRRARQRYPSNTKTTARTISRQSDFCTASLTWGQSSPRPNHQMIRTANNSSPANSRYLRYFPKTF